MLFASAALLAQLLSASPDACRVVVPAPRPAPDSEYAQNNNDARRRAPADPKNSCDIADSNLASAAKAILEQPNTAAATGNKPWDHRSPLKYADLVKRRFPLTTAEQKLLDAQGFVVSPRVAYASYAWAYHDVFQSQLPLYVTADSLFHAVFKVNDELIAAVEEQRLAPLTGAVLEAMACALPGAAKSYPPEVAQDVDVYLTVARSLLAGTLTSSSLGTDAQVKPLYEKALEGKGLSNVTLFGRPRAVDWSLYTPRGHYAKKVEGDDPPAITRYFRAATWLSRLEFNLVSRACVSSTVTADKNETPREATVAIALADLAGRAQALASIDQLDDAWTVLAGKREDVGLSALAKLRRDDKAPITYESAARLRAAIGKGFARTARLHYLPDGCDGELAAIATLLGPRVVSDSQATTLLVNPAVPGRYLVGAADMGYALGHDRAKGLLKEELSKHPALGAQLDAARALVQGPLPAEDLYSAWLDAVRSVAKKPAGTKPSFTRTGAFEDLQLNTTVAAFGQLRHNYVLIAGQSYDQGGCEIPDAYLEPAPAVYEALRRYAQRGAQAMARLDPADATRARAYFERLERLLTVFLTITKDELAGRPLSADERRFLSMPVELVPSQTGQEPTYTGWWFDLFRERVEEGLGDAAFIADYFTSGYTGRIAYAGARGPELGFFVIDSNGPPRLMVGPVARAYEYEGPLDQRVDDAASLTLAAVRAPWDASYRPPAAAEPPLAVRGLGEPEGAPREGFTPSPVFALKSSLALGPVTLELLDHHSAVISSATGEAGPTLSKVRFKARKVSKGKEPVIEGLRVRVGEAWWEMRFAAVEDPTTAGATYGGMEELPYDLK
jgi:hypothetical protein